MTHNKLLAIAIGLIFAVLLPNVYLSYHIDRLERRAIKSDDLIISLYRKLDSLKDVKHIYELDMTARRVHDERTWETIMPKGNDSCITIPDTLPNSDSDRIWIEYPDNSGEYVLGWKIIILDTLDTTGGGE